MSTIKELFTYLFILTTRGDGEQHYSGEGDNTDSVTDWQYYLLLSGHIFV